MLDREASLLRVLGPAFSLWMEQWTLRSEALAEQDARRKRADRQVQDTRAARRARAEAQFYLEQASRRH